MPVAIYGHFGVPVMVFPTADQDFEEYERQGMIETLEPFIQQGMVKLFCVSAINRESWMNRRISPAERAYRQALYDRHVSEELVSLIYHDCRGKLPIATVGSSFGAYHAANTLIKHPDLFRWCIAMSGIYDMSSYFDGHYDQNCLENNPCDYLARLQGKPIQELNQCSINVICGQGPWERVEWSRQLPQALARRGIEHNFDLWGHDVAHDWPWWKIQLSLYFPRLFS
ncbi:MAG: prolyl oligopeptidase family serine peptidase [Candidatus Eremiobacteraeota bacterium]|nr:prolyl oligopeptidase family serine peptidase [Candidatus Eremiobacteraeota bacterium]MCW5871858.1 prolyl oligopeptidase family serine peptidase [Candidatus Eremiobacteraeota bacterium]